MRASKFKVGDQVRRTTGDWRGMRVGGVDTVVDFDGSSELLSLRKFGVGHDAGNFELVPVAAATSTFKVGDKVRILDNSTRAGTKITEYEVGAEYDVERTCGDGEGGTGYIFNGHYQFLRPHQIELVDWDHDPRKAKPETLKIEAGKFYKTRDGRKVGPMEARKAYGGKYVWQHDGGRLIYEADGTNYQPGAKDLIAEWPTSHGCAAAQVDNLRDEYGPVGKAAIGGLLGGLIGKSFTVKVSNDNGKPKFKVGDRVQLMRDCGYIGTVKASPGDGYRDEPSYLVHWDWYGDNVQATTWYESELVTAMVSHATTPAIVCLIENGQPKPSTYPHVHPSRGHAGDEAARLARKYPGKEFGVYELVDTRQIAKPTYAHEWQRLAADGEKIYAIKELRGMTGMTLKCAKEAVEHWLAVGEPYSRLAA